jgi:hypothetical protein
MRKQIPMTRVGDYVSVTMLGYIDTISDDGQIVYVRVKGEEDLYRFSPDEIRVTRVGNYAGVTMLGYIDTISDGGRISKGFFQVPMTRT